MATRDSEAGAALRRATERGTRKTGLRAAVYLVVSALAAIAAAVLLTRYLDVRTEALRVPTVPVVVAAMDLPEATELRAESLAVVRWPEGSVPKGAVADPKGIVGRMTTSRMVKDEPVLESRLASPESGRGLAALLPAGMRAVAVRVDDVVGVAGFVHPGDHVDVIVTLKPESSSSLNRPISKIVLQNIRVLAVGKEVARNDASLDKSIAATVATLMVDSVQAERLALAASRGQLLLALRSRIDQAVVVTGGVEPAELVAGRAVPAPPPAAPDKGVKRPAAAPAPAPEKRGEVVEILRGDLFEQRDFDQKKGGKR